MSPRLAVACLLVTAACAGAQKTDSAQATSSVQERMRITNQPPFDVSVCQQRTLSLPQPPTEALLVGAVASSQPQVMECLVDPRSRAGGETTKVTVMASVTDQAGTHTVTGENLTPEGQQCIQATVSKRVPLQPLPPGAAKVEGQAAFIHEANGSPSVRFGVNEGSDFSGTLRLAQPTWCDCYAPYANRAPPILTATITLRRGSGTPADVTFEPSGSTEGDQLAACLKQKMLVLPATLNVDEVSFPYRFTHFNALATEPAANLPGELRFYQLDLVRGQHAAATAMALGTRGHAAEAYDTLAVQYQKDPKKNSALIPKLREQCATLVKAAEGWVAALEAQQRVDQQTVTLAQELKVKDSSWAEVETGSQGVLATTQQDLAGARQRLADDQALCVKLGK
ncbi:MAG TPA: hypothetical protein VK539_30240 [Myxococcaceae bacterium]|nr:hypothetical protein [Myxococcaceae bacterium]